jgi:hypothetical protein
MLRGVTCLSLQHVLLSEGAAGSLDKRASGIVVNSGGPLEPVHARVAAEVGKLGRGLDMTAAMEIGLSGPQEGPESSASRIRETGSWMLKASSRRSRPRLGVGVLSCVSGTWRTARSTASRTRSRAAT